MLNIYRRYRLTIVNFVYWFLFVYIIAGFVWWFIALDRQSNKLARYELGQVRSSMDSTSTPSSFSMAVRQVFNDRKMRRISYIGEGGTFLLVILVCALFVYRAVRRQMRLTHQQQNFMMAVTHELKTPISVAKLCLETLVKRKLTEEQQTKLLQSALTETERLNQLSNNILLASQLEESRYLSASEDVPFSSLVEQAVQSFKGRFPKRNLQADIQGGLRLQGDALLLELAVNNLIENALKYSPEASPVTVQLLRNNRSVELKVMDEGEGIPDDEKAMIFRKFYRVGSEQTRKTKGTGLGLYLSRSIIRKHRGTLAVTDNQPAGSIFTITF
jgi:two-component system, OmpR family, sensor histidine kinase CiaH